MCASVSGFCQAENYNMCKAAKIVINDVYLDYWVRENQNHLHDNELSYIMSYHHRRPDKKLN